MPRVRLARQVVDFVRSQAPEPRRRLRQALRDLAQNEGDIRSLEGPLQDNHRLRVGPYRIVLRHTTPKTIDCVFAERRGIVYEIFSEAMLDRLGGNDTTRNSITGGVLALNEFPAEYDKLRNDRSLIPNMACEMIRWQTPLAHMRRTATRDAELAGKHIGKDDKVVMWYVSGNRDESAIPRANEFLIDRKNAREHLSFGWGVHYCVGSRLAEMQLRILWEEVMDRYAMVEVVGKPVRVRSNFVKGFQELQVRLHPATPA